MGEFSFISMKQQFITIQSFMRTDLHLKGSELIVCALVYGFSQDGETWFRGSTEYIADWTGTDKKNVLRVLRNLVERGILEKQETKIVGSAKRCAYRFNPDCLKKDELQNVTRNDTEIKITESELQKNTRQLQNVTRQLQKDTRSELQNVTRNNIDNIVNDNIVEDNNILSQQKNVALTLFNETEVEVKKESKDKKTLFSNSIIGQMSVEEVINKHFSTPDYADIDITYYYYAVRDWSDSANEKRTNRGWLATMRTFMRTDREKGKLHTITKKQTEQIDINGAMEYLNRNSQY